WAVGRALYRDVTTWSKTEGASTITQQLVKNTALTNDQTWMRKTKEVMGAIYLERQRSKDEILEYYLNEIYFGNGIYGVEEAAQTFF
uniref:transglycosylase domain-containing protein n=1 Tax=Alkalibacillus haloalkaliphilus TaxID=94136 RepID=UPI000590BD9D